MIFSNFFIISMHRLISLYASPAFYKPHAKSLVYRNRINSE